MHESVPPAIAGLTKVEALDALGIIESFSVASLIEGADAMVKTANVRLIEVRLAMALGGKAFASCTGSVAAVTSAVEAGALAVAQEGHARQQDRHRSTQTGTAERNDLGMSEAGAGSAG